MQYKIDTLCYKCIMRTALSYLCDCLQLYTPSCTLHSVFDTLTVSASRFHIIPDSPLLVPEPVPSSAPIHGMTFPFLSDKNAPRTPSNQTSRHFFSQNNRPAMFSVLCCYLPRPLVCLSCVQIKFCIVNISMRAGACVCRIDSHHMR